MAGKQSKRHREESLLEIEIEDQEDTKRHKKSYNQIFSSILQDQQEQEQGPIQDLSLDIFTTTTTTTTTTTLQQQDLSSNFSESGALITIPIPNPNPDPEPNLHNSNTLSTSSVSVLKEDEEDDEKERVIRHLLEASDDELGIPNKVESAGDDDNVINVADFSLSFGDGFWEFEDEAANYYTLLQSQLFM